MADRSAALRLDSFNFSSPAVSTRTQTLDAVQDLHIGIESTMVYLHLSPRHPKKLAHATAKPQWFPTKIFSTVLKETMSIHTGF